MSTGNRISDEQRAEIIRLRVEQRMSITAIEEHFRATLTPISKSTLCLLLQNYPLRASEIDERRHVAALATNLGRWADHKVQAYRRLPGSGRGKHAIGVWAFAHRPDGSFHRVPSDVLGLSSRSKRDQALSVLRDRYKLSDRVPLRVLTVWGGSVNKVPTVVFPGPSAHWMSPHPADPDAVLLRDARADDGPTAAEIEALVEGLVVFAEAPMVNAAATAAVLAPHLSMVEERVLHAWWLRLRTDDDGTLAGRDAATPPGAIWWLPDATHRIATTVQSLAFTPTGRITPANRPPDDDGPGATLTTRRRPKRR